MNTIELSNELERATHSVEVFCGQERICSGSAVAFNNRGFLLTAAHVVVRLDYIQEDFEDPDTVVLVKSKFTAFQEYKIALCAPRVSLDTYIQKPLVIDLAVLIPVKQSTDIPYLEIRDNDLSIGEEVLMAGYPDEMELPFSFDRHLNYRNIEIKQQGISIEIARRLLMVKRGMIGHRSAFNFSDSNSETNISGEIIYIDNVMHSGASGGPVVTEDGKLSGIISQRAITDISYEDSPNLSVPSASCVAITPRAIISLLHF